MGFACEIGIRARFRADGSGQRKKIMRCRFFSGALVVSAGDQPALPFRQWVAPDVETKKALPARRAFLLYTVISVGYRVAEIRQR